MAARADAQSRPTAVVSGRTAAQPSQILRAEDSLASGDMKLEAYALGEDLWCITAVVSKIARSCRF